MLRAIIKFVLRIVTLLLYRVKVVGQENIEKDKSYIICPNHLSFWDAPVLVAALKRNDMYILAKEELYKNGFIRFIADVFGIYPVKPDSKSMESVKISLKILKNNGLLMIFPEGTRNGMAKGVKPKDGAIKLAIKANVPIIPVGFQGNFKPFKKIKVNIGEPIYYTEYKDEVNNKELTEELTDNLMKIIVKLRDEKI